MAPLRSEEGQRQLLRSPEARPGRGQCGVIGISVVAGPKDCALFESFWQKRKSQGMYPTVRESLHTEQGRKEGKNQGCI